MVTSALDPSDSVGVLDRFAPDAAFFVDPERFAAHLESTGAIDWLAVCSPNDLHDRHCRLGLEHGVDVLCEKPIVLAPDDLSPLQELEARTGRRIWTVLQLRTDEHLEALRRRLAPEGSAHRHEVSLTYVTARGRWYDTSWKGDIARSGGLSVNIGVHMFDLLLWLFGPLVDQQVHLRGPRRMAGVIELARARVRWFLSVEADDVPAGQRARGERTFRILDVDGERLEISRSFTDLHRRVYERTLAGTGFGIDVARSSIDLAHRVRTGALRAGTGDRHELLR